MNANDHNENYGDGWIKLFRSIRRHWLWEDPKKFQWWIDLLLEANHAEKKVLLGNTLHSCLRGQCLRSLRGWSRRWMTTPKTTLRFLKLLENENMITTQSVGNSTRITICEYERYQSVVNTKDHTPGYTKSSPSPHQVPTNKELKNERKEPLSKKSDLKESSVVSKENEQEKKSAKKLFEAARVHFPGTKRGDVIEFENFYAKNKKTYVAIAQRLIPAINKQVEWRKNAENYNTRLQPQERRNKEIHIPAWKNFRTWINQHGWEDELQEIPGMSASKGIPIG